MNQRWASHVLIGVNALAGAFLLAMLLRPSGVVRRSLAQWWASRQAMEYVKENWLAISHGASTLGRGGEPDLVVFSDYECPYCRVEHHTIEQWLGRRAHLTITVRHFPLSFHPHAFSAAVAAVCASAAGRFAAMDSLLFADTSWKYQRQWGRFGSEAGITDTTHFKDCLQGDSASAVVQQDMAIGSRLNITGTPTFVNRVRTAPGTLPEWALDSLVNSSSE